MLDSEMQRAQRFPACPPNPDTSVFAELFPASQPAPSQPHDSILLNQVPSTFLQRHLLALGWNVNIGESKSRVV